MEGYISEIRMFGGTFAPRGWAFCAAQLMSIAEYTALYSLVGTTYGGNGTVNFGLPDLRSRVAVGTGQGPGLSDIQLGEMAGSENATLLSSNLPPHNHMVTFAVPGTENDATTASGNGKVLATSASSMYGVGTSTPMGQFPATLSPTGGNAPVPLLQPYLAINFIICLEGIFPSRN